MATPTLKKAANKENKSPIGNLLFKYLPYWPLFVIFIVGSLFAAWFYLRTTAPQYEINASVMLKEEKESRKEDVINSLDVVSGKKVVDNEIELLKSKTLMHEVVKQLYLYAPVFEENELIPKSAYTLSPVQIEVNKPDQLKAVEKVAFTFHAKDSLVSIGANKYPMNQFVTTPYGQLKFVANQHQYDQPTKPLYFNLVSPRVIAADLLAGLRITASSKQTTVITLKLKDTDPRRGEDVLNQLIAEHNKSNLEDKNKIAATASEFIEGRLQLVEKELLDIEKKAQAYKTSRGAVDISTQGQLYLQNITETDQKLSDVNSQLSVLNEVDKYLKSKGGTDGAVPTTLGLKDATMGTLVNKLYEEELAYEKLRKTTGENNPTLVAIRDRINKMKPSLEEHLNSQRSALEASKLNLHSTSNGFSSMLQSIPQKERELIDINRQQAIKSNLYEFLLRKKEESDLAKNEANFGNTRLVDKAQASFGPVSPKGKLIYIVAFIVALAIPAGFVSAKELLNRKVLFRHEIEALTNAPIIGEISLDKSKDPLVIQEGKRTFIAEQFRRMRTSIGYVGGASGKKKILVTSTLSGEGKSFVAVNLALSIALTNKKVALLELDLANPSLSSKLNVNYEMGVSSYLWGECEPEDIIKRTSVNENLFFLPSGPLPENPSELLMSERMKELLSYLEDVFDVIVIDSAPASLLSDAYVLSPMCDLTLYVVKHKFTPKTYLERLDEDNSGNQLTNMRIVFNGIQSRGFTKNGYGYGYGYGYIHNNNGKQKKKGYRSDLVKQPVKQVVNQQTK